MKKIVNFGQFLDKINESVSNDDLLGHIDYTLLSPSATEDEILDLCSKAVKLGVKSVCVLPKMVSVAAEVLAGTPILVCTVVSFPEGSNTPEQKLAETKQVIADGADEVDMVLDYPKLKEMSKLGNEYDPYTTDQEKFDTKYNKKIEYLGNDVKTLVDYCHTHKNKNNELITLKVIVESGLLTEEQTKIATEICLQANADFIKTSTGMVSVGAELDKVKIMKDIINQEGSNMKIKASGGIRTLADLKKFAPFVDRFGVGFGSVDAIFGDAEESDSDY
jgi:deoxyribose-phosphate aldolase